MKRPSSPFGIVLAGGSGTRLSELTTDEHGVAVPKQFCSLRGGRSLLLDAINRAHQLVPRDRIVVVVAAEHERWWRSQLDCIDRDNIVVQPENRGTCAGLLLPLLHIHAREPGARVAVLPSDHYIENAPVLRDAMRQALANVAQEPANLVLLGIAPDAPDTELGWIVPGRQRGNLPAVEAFVEKPGAARAHALMQAGGVWNSFLLAASIDTLVALCRLQAPEVAIPLIAACAQPRSWRQDAIESVYRQLPNVDFSRAVLQRATDDLRVLQVPECGWTDLGTPRRVADCIARIERSPARRLVHRAPWFDTVDLARAFQNRPQGIGVGA